MNSRLKKNKTGFTIVELMVAIGILMFITVLAMVAYKQTGSTRALSASAQKLASDIRRMQSYSLDFQAKEGTNIDDLDSWGVSLNPDNTGQYYLFADFDNHGIFSDSATEEYEKIVFQEGVRINKLTCIDSLDAETEISHPKTLNINFFPPSASVLICNAPNYTNCSDTCYKTKIELTNGTKIKQVYVNKFGLIDVLE